MYEQVYPQPLQGQDQAGLLSEKQDAFRAFSMPEFIAAKRKPLVNEQEHGILPERGNVNYFTTTAQETFRQDKKQTGFSCCSTSKRLILWLRYLHKYAI